MSSAIRRLPQAVADAIAAGEVIERPASVVKELLENALDAGATRVTVLADGGGLVRIEVSDDGEGIAATDLGLAIAPHATSKITGAADLERVRTLGFRGEALASIAAVAELRLVSATAPGAAAYIAARGAAVVEQGAAGAPRGTTVSVCELFATTPARLRFLRGERAEAAAIRRVCAETAMLHPAVALTLCINGDEALRTTGSASTMTVLREVLGNAAAAGLVAIDAPGEIWVSGALSPPPAHQAQRSGLVIAVNGRRVHSPALLTAVDDAYRGLIPAGRHPYGVLRVDLDPSSVDVNVHPTKREVRFRDERSVFATVQRACWAALREASNTVPVFAGAGWLGAAGAQAERSVPQEKFRLDDAADGEVAVTDLSALAPLTALGQGGGAWVVATSGRGAALVVVDPHAAEEKALYVELMQRWSDGSPDRQLLLLPVVVDVSADRLEQVEEHIELLATCGYDVEVFGAAQLRCTAVPAQAAAAEPARLVAELVGTLDGAASADRLRHRFAALTACHAAVRFGDRLSLEAQQRIVDRLPATPGGSTCPHGRPTALVLDDSALRRTFRRPPG